GGNIEVPLSEPGALRQIDVKERMEEMADKIRGLVGEDDDPEAKVITGKLNSGNYDEQDLANIHAHLSSEGAKKYREEHRAEREEQKAEREARKAEREEEKRLRDEERQKRQEEFQKQLAEKREAKKDKKAKTEEPTEEPPPAA